MWLCSVLCFFFKQKTAYEMRISDWSSDVCSSDLFLPLVDPREAMQAPPGRLSDGRGYRGRLQPVERGLEALVVPQRRTAPDETQDLVGTHLHQQIGRASCRESVCQYV